MISKKDFNQTKANSKSAQGERTDDARPARATTKVEGDKVVKKESVLVIERARLEIRRNSFPIRAAKGWNELPEEVKSSTSINGFKTAYDRWWNTKTEKTDD